MSRGGTDAFAIARANLLPQVNSLPLSHPPGHPIAQPTSRRRAPLIKDHYQPVPLRALFRPFSFSPLFLFLFFSFFFPPPPLSEVVKGPPVRSPSPPLINAMNQSRGGKAESREDLIAY